MPVTMPPGEILLARMPRWLEFRRRRTCEMDRRRFRAAINMTGRARPQARDAGDGDKAARPNCSSVTSAMLTIGAPLPALLTRQSSRPKRGQQRVIDHRLDVDFTSKHFGAETKLKCFHHSAPPRAST